MPIRRLLPRSLRWRLQLWVAFLLVCVLSGFGFAVDRLIRGNRFRQIDADLELRVGALGRALREAAFVKREPRHRGERRPPPDAPARRPPPGPPDGSRPGRPPEPPPAPVETRPASLDIPLETAALFGEETGSYYYSVWYRDGTLLKRSASAPENQMPQSPEQDTLIHWQRHGPYREAFHCSGFGDCVLAGRSLEADLNAMRNFDLALLVAGGTLLALSLGVGAWLTSLTIRPIDRISEAAVRISRGNLAERIPITDRENELGRLAAVLNSTFARLEAAFVQQRQFTADAAHELRTPLAVLIAETQTTLARERTAPEYREALEACLDAAQQMRRLTESLLELARLDAGSDAIARESVDLAGIARECIERIRPLAETRGIRIEADLAPAHAFTSADRTGQVITNLLTNAVDYNKPNGEIRVTTNGDSAAAIFSVSDTGVGIADSDLAHVFDRFYCVDKARSRASGHSGLGLAICKAIVEAERGSIDVASALHSGSTFTVRLPARRPAPDNTRPNRLSEARQS